MAKKVDLELVLGSLNVKESYYQLGVAEKAAFENAPVEVVFSETFLNKIRKHLGIDQASLAERAEPIRKAFREASIQSMQELVALSVEDLIKIPRMGELSCPIILDVLMLFGYTLKRKQAIKHMQPIDRARAAKDLLNMLGID